MQEKIRIPVIKLSGNHFDEKELLSKAEAARLNKRLFVVADANDEETASLQYEMIRQICETAIVPVIGFGVTKRLEDVKKMLYAGCQIACIDLDAQADLSLLEEASARFGASHVALYAKDAARIEASRQEIESLASYLLIPDGALPEIALPRLVTDCEGYLASYDTDFSLKQCFSWSELKTNSDGLVPCITQDAKSGEVLMMAYMNEAAYLHTLDSGRMFYYSRSRDELWEKGETSGHRQFVRELLLDCDNDTILAKVEQLGAACHTGNRSCFYRPLADGSYAEYDENAVMQEVFSVILDRKANPKEGSYTNYLFDKGLDKILKKVGEEASETIIAAKNESKMETVYEISDLLYHLLVLMAEKGISWSDVLKELARR